MESLISQWNSIKEQVRQECNIPNSAYKTWIEPLQFHSIRERCVFISFPPDQSIDVTMALDYISRKYRNFFQVAISDLCEMDLAVEFISDHAPAAPNHSFAEISSPNLLDANLNPKYKFDTFVVGGNNKLAYSASLAVSESLGNTYNPLYIYGGAGLGKTHLMHSIGHFVLEKNPHKKVIYVTSEVFTNEVIESIRSGNAQAMTKLREKYRTVDMLMVDDVQFIIGKESTQEEFFHTFNVLHSAGKQIVISSDKHPKKMETLDERFRSRFEWGLITDIQAPDYETRMAILRKNCENYPQRVGDDVIEYIASNIKANIRELEGALNKIIAFAKLTKADITLDLAQEALKDMIFPGKSREVSFDLIVKMVASQFNVHVEDILSRKRSKEFAIPRQIAMYLSKELLPLTYNEIGSKLNRDHSTIIHGCNAINNEVSSLTEIGQVVEVIKKKLYPQN